MDLTQLYGDPSQYIAGYDDFARGAMKSQEIRNRNFEYKKAQENYEAEKGLKALFARNPNPSMEEIGALSPEFAQAYGKNQFAMQKDLLEMQKNQADIRGKQLEHGEKEQKMLSEAGAPIAHKYLMQYGENMPPEALDAFRHEIGNELAKVEKQHNIKPQEGFDINQLTPIDVATRAHKYWPSPIIEQQNKINTERQLSNLPNRPSGGTVQTTPEGFQLPVGPGTNLPPNGPPMGGGYGGGQQPLFRNPPTGTGLANPNANVGPGAGMPQPPQTQPQLGQPGQPEPEPNIPEQDIARFQEIYRSLPPGREKDAAAHALANSVKRILPNGGVHEDQGQVITPEKLAEIRRTEEQNKADIQTKALEERKTAESEIERQQSRQKAIEAFSLVPPLKEVEDLIIGSTSGKKQKQAADLFEEYTGKSTPGMRNIGKLGPIAGRLRDAVNRAPGSQSDKDAIIESLKTGNIENPEIAAETRVESYKEFVRQMREMIKNQTGLDATSSAGETSGQGPVKVKSASEAANLPPGTLFMKEDGTLHRRK